MTDKDRLKQHLRDNAGAILEILKQNGVNVDKYKSLVNELEEKKKKRAERARVHRQNYEQSATAFLNKFAYAEARQEEANNIQALKDCVMVAENSAEALQQFLSMANDVKNGKKPCYKEEKPLRLKSLENCPGILETARKRQAEREEERAKLRAKAKQEYIKYYSENWLIILLDAIKKYNMRNYKRRQKITMHSDFVSNVKRMHCI